MKATIFVIAKRMALILIIIITTLIFTSNLWLRSISQSPESAAIGNIRTVVGSQAAFVAAEQGYAGTWKQLRDDPIAEGKPAFLDIDLSDIVQEYEFTLMPAGESLTGTSGGTVYTHFICIARPHKYSKETKRSFYVDSSGVVRWEDGRIPTRNSEPL